MKNKHMNQHDRLVIENGLNNHLSFKAIALKLGKDCTTISKEVRTNMLKRDISGFGRVFNNCIHRTSCHKEEVCDICKLSKPRLCRACKFCRDDCQNFIEEVCPKLSKPPYVCNSCVDKQKCTLSKQMYFSLQAHKQYTERLSESRSGFSINESEINHLNDLFVPLCKNQGQSIHHVFINHADEIMFSEKTIYSFVDQGILKVRNIDLPRKVRYRPRRKKSTTYKVDKACLEGRRYEDFLSFIQIHPDMPIVQMDTVEGKKGECEVTHEFIRRINSKGHSWDPYTQKDINLMMSHINSYARVKLNKKSPHLLFKTLYGEDVLNIFNMTYIELDDINLTNSLISK